MPESLLLSGVAGIFCFKAGEEARIEQFFWL
jgi:hypothetical protein